MTAILGCCAATTPLIMGDVIESVAAAFAPPSVYVPSVGVVDLISRDSSRRISGLIQKVALVGPNLAIAWSGSVDAARGLLTTIRDANNIQPFDFASLRDFLDHQAPSVTNREVGLMCIVRNGENWKMFGINTKEQQDDRYVGILSDGTGADNVVAQLRQIDDHALRGAGVHPAYLLGSALSGALIAHEMHHLDSLSTLYGGAYEIATVANGRCTKLDDVMYVHWVAQATTEGITLRSLSRVFRYLYWNDILVIRTVTLDIRLSRDFTTDDSYTLVPTVFRDLTPEDIRNAPTPPLRASLVSHLITCRALDGNVFTMMRLDAFNPDVFQIGEIDQGDGTHRIEVRPAPELVQGITEELARALG